LSAAPLTPTRSPLRGARECLRRRVENLPLPACGERVGVKGSAADARRQRRGDD